MSGRGESARVLALLSVGQMLGWGLSFYFTVVAASAIAADLQVSASEVLSGISLMLMSSAVSAVPAGHLLSRCGTRVGLTAGTVALGASGLMMAWATSVPGYLAAVCLAGAAAPLTLTQAAVTVVQYRLRPTARFSLATIATASAFSPAILWPPFLWLEPIIGWRGCCVALALSVLTIGTACNGLAGSAKQSPLPPPAAAHVEVDTSTGGDGFATLAALAMVFGATGMVTWGLAASLVTALESSGHGKAVALAIGAAVGPAQIFGRVLDVLLSARLDVASVGSMSLCLMLLGTIMLAIAPDSLSVALIGALSVAVGAGAFTIVRSMLPMVLIQHGFARRLGYLSAVQNLAVAIGPLSVALMVGIVGVGPAFLACASIILAALVLYLATLRRHTLSVSARAGSEGADPTTPPPSLHRG